MVNVEQQMCCLAASYQRQSRMEDVAACENRKMSRDAEGCLMLPKWAGKRREGSEDVLESWSNTIAPMRTTFIASMTEGIELHVGLRSRTEMVVVNFPCSRIS